MSSPSASVTVAPMTKLGVSSARIPPRKPMAAMANMAPDARPSSAGFQVKPSPPVLRGHDTRSTPVVAMAMAAATLGLTLSPRKARPPARARPEPAATWPVLEAHIDVPLHPQL